MENLVSIIVPAHNVQDVISRCINSLRNQFYQKIEIIVVCNACNDQTVSISETLKSSDSRIKVFQTEVAGVSNARNIGLDNAKGKYIFFCDADDTYEDDYVSTSLDCLLKYNIDMLILGYHNITQEGQVERCGLERKLNYIEFERALLFDETCLSSVWNKVFRKDIIDQIRFKTDIAITEDRYFLFEIIENKKDINIYYHPKCVYNYYTTANSVTTKVEKLFLATGELEYAVVLKKLLRDFNLSEEIEKDVYANIYYMCALTLRQYCRNEKMKEIQKQYLKKEMKKNRFCFLKSREYNLLKKIKYLFFDMYCRVIRL